MATVQRRRQPAGEAERIKERFAEFRRLKREEADAKKGHEKIRDNDLLPYVQKHGTVDPETGSQVVQLAEAVDGFSALQRQRRASPMFLIDKATALAKRKKILAQVSLVGLVIPAEHEDAVRELLEELEIIDDCEITEPRLSQARFLAYHQENRTKLTVADVDSCKDIDVTWAFVPLK